MANKIVQLIDANDDNIFPLSSDPNAAHITMTNTDPGEGAALGQNEFVAVYGDDPIIMDYSTSEINTGAKWIDGSPIYKKTIQSTLSGTLNYVPTGVPNLNLLIDWRNTVIPAPNRQHLIGFRMGGAGSLDYIMMAVQYNKDSNELIFEFGSQYAGEKTVYTTIWYTKSS